MTTMIGQRRHDTNADVDPSRRLVEFLRRADAYSEKTRSVRQIETHISWIFLTDHFAYKLKKPVRFDFLDFSTAELRYKACEHEVELNRRLAPGVYLGVVPIVMTGKGELGLDQQGTSIDWVVKMRRLPAENALDVMIRQGKVSPAVIERLAKALSDFYDNVPPVTLTVDDYRQSIERHVIANWDELASGAHHLDPRKVRRVHSAQLRVLNLVPDMLDTRVRNGRIVEGHGDLRPEHIYFTPSPRVIDCIEFSREFRTLDVIDELAFLSMECDFLGAEGIVEPVFDRYFEQSGDSPPRQLIDFYRLYRACVRAKVSALRAEQVTDEARARLLASASKYLDLADQYSENLGPPLVVLVRGLPGTGKSTIAQTISEQLGFELLQTDAVRQSVLGPGSDHAGFNEGRYHPENRLRVYNSMHEHAERLLNNKMSVVLDGTYLAASQRREAADLAKQYHAAFLAVHCQCPDEIALQRIKARTQARTSLSEARPEFYERQRKANAPDLPHQHALAVDTSSNVDKPMRSVFEALRKKCFGDLVVSTTD